MSYIFNLIPDDRHIFLHIPKNGGHSVATALKKYNKSPPFQTRLNPNLKGHKTYLETERIVKNKNQEKSGFVYFCTIRNPWDRMVSFYNYMKKHNHKITGFGELNDKVNNGLSFENFVPLFVKQGLKEFRPQIDYITNDNGEVVVECLKLNNIQDCLFNFLKNINTPEIDSVKVDKLNKSNNKNYQEFYTSQETIDMVAEYEKKIIDKFNYKF